MSEIEQLRALSAQDQARAEEALIVENELRAEIEQLRRHRTELDCHYTMGNVADLSGSHCPHDEPCLRCDNERLRALGSRLIDAMDDMHNRGETFTARVSVASAALRATLKDTKP